MVSRFYKCLVWASLVAGLGLFGSNVSAQANLWASGQAMLANGNAEGAYRELLVLEDRLAGTPQYDYLLGLAALESGRPDAATFALERALTVDPEFFGARLDLARAYFALGNQDLAQIEFKALLALNPPAAARQTINTYLETIAQRNQATQVRYFVEAGLGYNTNANGATGEGSVSIPNFGVVTLDAKSQATEDAFARAKAGMNVVHKWNEQTRLRTSLSLDYLDYVTTDGFETNNFDLGVGADFIRAEDTYKFDLSSRFVKLDWYQYQLNVSLGVQWQRIWNKQTQTTVFAQHNRIRFRRGADQGNDGNLNLIGASVVRALDDSGKTLVSASGFLGVDAERNTRLDGSREVFGARLASQIGIRNDLGVFGSAGVQWSLYDRTNGIFGIRRRDLQMDASIGMLWRPATNWSVRPQLDLVRNLTDIPTNAYERLKLGLTVRRAF
jgi:outer membrane protein